MTEPDWKIAEKQCAKILDGYYKYAHRAGPPGRGDVLYLGDVIAASPEGKILLAQVKDNQTMGTTGVRNHRKQAVRQVDGDHVRYEVWCRGSDDWRIYPVPVVETGHLELIQVKYLTLPLDVTEAIEKYAKFRSGDIELKELES